MTDKSGSKNASDNEDKKKGTKRFVLGIVMFLILVGVSIAYLYTKNRVKTDDAQIDGTFMTVSSKIHGSVSKVFVADNQKVNVGDPLVQIDTDDIDSKVALASATVDQAIASLQKAKSAPEKANAILDKARASLKQAKFSQKKYLAELNEAKAELSKTKISFTKAKSSDQQIEEANIESKKAIYEKAKNDLKRMNPLAERQEISKQQFDSYTTAFEVAESELKAARRRMTSVKQNTTIRAEGVNSQDAKVAQAEAEFDKAKAEVEQAKAVVGEAIVGVKFAKAEVNEAQAGVERARAHLNELLLQLSYTTIKAPIAGVVTRKTVEVGQNIQPGQGLMILVNLDDVWVTANYKETQLSKVKPGQKVEIYVDLSGSKLSGRVDSISGATGARMSLLPPENAVGNFVKVVQRIPVKIVFDSEDLKKEVLRPGTSVETIILTSK